MRAAYCNLRTNAKRRGKEFDLTFEQFSQFCIESDYIRGKGKKSTSYSIDRINNDGGYTIDNIAVMELGHNSRKGTMRLDAYYDEFTKSVVATVRKTAPDADGEEYPF